MFSGGLDSTVVLLQEIKRSKVFCILFSYEQQHSIEIQHAVKILKDKRVDYEIIKLPKLGKEGDVFYGRNLVFLTYAFMAAKKLNASKVVCGFCEGDNDGFPDCRKTFLESIEVLLNTTYGSNILIETPLLNVNKKDTFLLAANIEELEYVRDNTLTCYKGNIHVNYWGKGCGKCNSCLSRKKGYDEFEKEVKYV